MRILIVSGGSGGHIFPAIAACRELSKMKETRILFAASRRRLDMELLEKEPFQKTFFTINPMPHKLDFRIFVFLLKTFTDTLKAVYMLITYRPHAVVGFGGYTGSSLILVASIMGIPTLIHEQNFIPGRANKILDKFASKVCVSFEESREFFKNKNIIYTGNPIRAHLLEENNKNNPLDLEPGRFTVLVMGGSQGAHSLNKLAVEAISGLDKGIKKNLQVIHIAGKSDYEMVEDAYARQNIKNKTFRFIDRVEDAYRASDLAISRAGAAACFELAYFKKPMVLVPIPYKNNNQRFNAQVFASHGACIYREEKDLSRGALKSIIEELVQNTSKRNELAQRAGLFSRPEAAGNLAREITGLCRNVK